jgi:uncharacterized Zn-finger protein
MTRASLWRRLEALEAKVGIDVCPYCGGGSSEAGDTHSVVFVEPEESGENAWCSYCGRQTRVVLEWGNDQTS